MKVALLFLLVAAGSINAQLPVLDLNKLLTCVGNLVQRRDVDVVVINLARFICGSKGKLNAEEFKKVTASLVTLLKDTGTCGDLALHLQKALEKITTDSGKAVKDLADKIVDALARDKTLGPLVAAALETTCGLLNVLKIATGNVIPGVKLPVG